MATRALIRFAERQSGVSFSDFKLYDDCSRQIVTHQIYHHYDGSPDFLGVALAEFISNVGQAHNGVDCFAAQMLTHIIYGGVKIKYGLVYSDTITLRLTTVYL